VQLTHLKFLNYLDVLVPGLVPGDFKTPGGIGGISSEWVDLGHPGHGFHGPPRHPPVSAYISF